MLAVLGKRLARAAHERAMAAALDVGRRIAPAAAEGRGPVARFSSTPDMELAPLGSIGPIGRDGLPLYVNWDKYGAVTPVQDQGDCGSCWAYGCTGIIEAANFFANKELLKLSEQQLIDCNNISNDQCDGGWVEVALEYVKRNGGILQEKDYPYIGKECPPKRITALGVTIDDFQHFRGKINEYSLKSLVASSPVAATVGCDPSFIEYQDTMVGQVLNGPDYTIAEMEALGISHAVVIIGYDETYLGHKYWLVKSSHGGEFMLIARENGTAGGAFGIARSIRLVGRHARNVLVTSKTDKELGLGKETGLRA